MSSIEHQENNRSESHMGPFHRAWAKLYMSYLSINRNQLYSAKVYSSDDLYGIAQEIAQERGDRFSVIVVAYTTKELPTFRGKEVWRVTRLA